MYHFKTAEMEYLIAQWFEPRLHLVIPNVSWGLGLHECDLLIVSESGYLTEVEIKVSRADLIADKNKRHGHRDYKNRIKQLYFAIPYTLEKDVEHIPSHAGILTVKENRQVYVLRGPEVNNTARKITPEERYKIARLGALRIWDLKKKLLRTRGIELCQQK